MPSLIIYKPETGEIVQARKRPFGDAPELTIENCFPYDPDAKNKYKSFWAEEEINTLEAKYYHVVEGKLSKKG